ncbi:hypothetical protein GC194_12615 [bacterium]|nr:hypothetical protein [bacterium]
MLDPVEKEILLSLTFEESLQNLLEETSEKPPVVIDALKTLLAKDMVQAFATDPTSGQLKSTAFFDSDNLFEFMFRATAKGLNALDESH